VPFLADHPITNHLTKTGSMHDVVAARSFHAVPHIFLAAQNISSTRQGSWTAKTLQLLHEATSTCAELDPCRAESLRGMAVLLGLCFAILIIVCAFAFLHQDREEQITPLCPQLVHEGVLEFRMPFDMQTKRAVVVNKQDKALCKVCIVWPDPKQAGTTDVAATVRLQSIYDITLATVVARNVAIVGQDVALCRAGCSIFGFVEPDGDRQYHVRHRAGIHLLTFTGDFTSLDLVGVNGIGAEVCWFKVVGGVCVGRVLPQVDAGLVMCSVLATVIHRWINCPTRAPLACLGPFQPGDPFIKEGGTSEAQSDADLGVDGVSTAHSEAELGADGMSTANTEPDLKSVSMTADGLSTTSSVVDALEDTPLDPTGEPGDEHAKSSPDQLAEQSAEQQAEQPATQQAETPAEQQAEKPAEQAAEQISEMPAEQPAEKPAEKPTEQLAEKPAHKTAQTSAEKLTEQLAGQVTEHVEEDSAAKSTGLSAAAEAHLGQLFAEHTPQPNSETLEQPHTAPSTTLHSQRDESEHVH